MLNTPCPKCEAENALYIEEDFLAGKYVQCLYCSWIGYLESKTEKEEIFDGKGRILRGPSRGKAQVLL